MSVYAKYDLLESLKERDNVDMIENQIYLCEVTKVDYANYNYPIKTDLTICCLCLEGETRGKIDLIEQHVKAPGLAISMPGQILEPGSFSNDFKGILIYMTRRFTENFNLLLGHSISMNLKNRPNIALTEKELQSILTYCQMVRSAIRVKANPYRLQIVTHLTIAHFYGIGYFLHQSTGKELTKNETITERFLQKVRDSYKTERRVEYYAELLELSPNYLSHVVKDVTGKTAGQWIDEYVTLEAKALLKSTNMTVQQVANDLNFPTQSFFGKFFKRMVGVAPKYYK
ncbi:MAG: helix-turn-helix domain-containing protein [Chitinophagaceae bacterium]